MGSYLLKKIEIGNKGVWKSIFDPKDLTQIHAPHHETLTNFIKQNTQQKEKRRNKERERERGPKSKLEEQYPKWVTKGQGNK
jgi:hypothetical protein